MAAPPEAPATEPGPETKPGESAEEPEVAAPEAPVPEPGAETKPGEPAGQPAAEVAEARPGAVQTVQAALQALEPALQKLEQAQAEVAEATLGALATVEAGASARITAVAEQLALVSPGHAVVAGVAAPPGSALDEMTRWLRETGLQRAAPPKRAALQTLVTSALNLDAAAAAREAISPGVLLRTVANELRTQVAGWLAEDAKSWTSLVPIARRLQAIAQAVLRCDTAQVRLPDGRLESDAVKEIADRLPRGGAGRRPTTGRSAGGRPGEARKACEGPVGGRAGAGRGPDARRCKTGRAASVTLLNGWDRAFRAPGRDRVPVLRRPGAVAAHRGANGIANPLQLPSDRTLLIPPSPRGQP